MYQAWSHRVFVLLRRLPTYCWRSEMVNYFARWSVGFLGDSQLPRRVHWSAANQNQTTHSMRNILPRQPIRRQLRHGGKFVFKLKRSATSIIITSENYSSNSKLKSFQKNKSARMEVKLHLLLFMIQMSQMAYSISIHGAATEMSASTDTQNQTTGTAKYFYLK